MVAFSKVVIAGGGIVGNSIAYYLAKSKPEITIVLVDPVGIAPGASSKAGGFLAKEWRDGTPLESMQRLGFELHQELANDLGADNIDYRRLSCHNVVVGATNNSANQDGHKMKNNTSKTKKNEFNMEWADLNIVDSSIMGDYDSIAQVHPRKLCEAMWKNVSKISADSELRKGKIVKAITEPVEKLNDDELQTPTFSITGVELEDGNIVETDALVVACGPWTEEARSWFPSGVNKLPEITGIKCHSMLVKPKSEKIFDQAVFFDSDDDKFLAEDASLEVYPRPDGDCYVNGFEGEEVVVQESPGQETVSDTDINLMKEAMTLLSSELGNTDPHTKQACYWPETPDGMPCIGPISGIDGAYVAAGHSVWGILQGPITGKALVELMLERKSKTLDLTDFHPNRFFVEDMHEYGREK